MNHLVITVGQSDLQVARANGESRCRHKLDKESIRTFHEALMSGTIPFTVVPFNETSQWVEQKVNLHFLPQTGMLESGLLPESSSDMVEINARAGVVIAAPLVSKLLSDPALRAVQFDSVLILTTFRHNRRDEPVGVFHVLRDAIAATLSLPPTKVVEVQFLVNNETVFEEDEAGQRYLLSSAAKRIDDAIATLRSAAGPNKMAIYVSDSGGIPDVKAVLAASVRYRADEVRFVGASEFSTGNRPQRKLIAVGPAESLNLRRHVRRLVRQGAFAEAAVLAESSIAEQTHAAAQEPWRRWLRQTVATLGGVRPDGGKKGKTPALLEEIFRMGPGLWTAFRVESALRAGDFREALRWQFTFADIARAEFQMRLMKQEAEIGEKPSEIVDKWTESREKQVYIGFIRKLLHLRDIRNLVTHGWTDENNLRIEVQSYFTNGLWQRDPISFLASEVVRNLIQSVAKNERNAAPLYQELIAAILSDMDEFSLLETPAG